MSKSYLCNYDYDNELNTKINKRHFPSSGLQPNFDPRPLSTKYALLNFPLENQYVSDDTEPLVHYEKYDNRKVFYPGNSKAPISHFLDNIDTESTLKISFNLLQNTMDQTTYPTQSLICFWRKLRKIIKNKTYKLPHKVRGTDNKNAI